MRSICILICLLGFATLRAQSFEATVIDSATGEALPSVSVLYNKARALGTTTDNNGHFVISDRSQIVQIEISFIGYYTKIIPRQNLPKGSHAIIKLKPEQTQLEEAVVKAKENPALRIVRNAMQAKDLNDPKKYNSYFFKSYSKNILTRKDTSLGPMEQLNKMQAQKNDSTNRYFLISETVSLNKYKAPNLHDERIIGTRISGFKQAIYALGTKTIQTIGLYDESIVMLTQYFPTPLSRGADKKYAFILKDTIVKGADTTYIMDYFPSRGTSFNGLKGEIWINTNKWAIEYVTARPYYKSVTSFLIEQHYRMVNNQYWFPDHMSAIIDFERLPFYKVPGILYNQVFLDSIQINLPLRDKEFDQVSQEIDEKAPYVKEDFWQKNRQDSLTLKEQRTYTYMDSIGKRYKFDFLMGATRNIYRGYITVGKLEYKATKFLSYNGQEGVRLGAGVYTNDRFSKVTRFGGYFGYGTRDHTWKYGGTLEFFLNYKKGNKIALNYSNDLMQPGRVTPEYYYNTNFWYEFFIQEMDRKEEFAIDYQTRISTYTTLDLGVRRFNISTNNDYYFLNRNAGDLPVKQTSYGFGEVKAQLRWAYKEKITSNLGRQISMGSDYPVFLMSYTRGIKDFLNSDFDYNKMEFGMWYERNFKGWGYLDMRLEAGYVDQVIPLQELFSQRGTNSNTFALISRNSFQTMYYNEFFADKYISLFVNHNFGPMFRWGRFSPDLEVYHAMAVGGLSHPELHQGFSFKTLEKGYYESGVAIPNLIKIKVARLGYLGLGAGAFYRYGPYQLPVPIDNWVFKGGFTFSIN